MELKGLKHYLRVVTTPATPDVEIGPLSDDNYYDYGGAVGSQWGKDPAITLPTIGEEINVFAYSVLSLGDYILETSDALQIDAGTKLTMEDTAFRVVKYLSMVSSTRMKGVVVGASDYRNSYTFAESGTYFIVADSKILGTATVQKRKKVAFAKSMLWTPGVPEVLTDTEIEEPIGFDTLQVYAKRGEFHGMSAQVSDSNLEFYGGAIDLIKSHYEADVDTWIGYIIKNSDGNNIYEGALDLSTYTEKDGEYASVSCKVGEVGPKTTLNNRTGNEINISEAKI